MVLFSQNNVSKRHLPFSQVYTVTYNPCWVTSMSFFKYCKIPKISPGAYIFQRPFLRGLFLEGLIFRGAHLRKGICVSKSIRPANRWKEIYHFCFVLLCIWGQFPSTSPPGAYIWRGDVTEGNCVMSLGCLYLEGLRQGGAYFRNFTVSKPKF